MNKTAVKNFAVWARNKLIEDVKNKAVALGITKDGIAKALPQSGRDIEFYDIGLAEPCKITGSAISQRRSLVDAINAKAAGSDYQTAYNFIMEEVAYTWFNRLIAIRFMEVNDYLPGRIRVLSAEGNKDKVEPDIAAAPFDAGLQFSNAEAEQIAQLKSENKLDELFRILFIKQCNALNKILPFLFEKTSDYTELLLNLSVTDNDGVVRRLINDIPEEDFLMTTENNIDDSQIEIIGWLYQYYISEKHDEIVNIYKGVISKENIPAATQLFTTDWVVKYMVDNSLGRYWIERHPESTLQQKLKYFVLPKSGHITYINDPVKPQDLTFFDPCMGSGHILVYAFDVLMEIYKECGYTERDAITEILTHNLFGLDVDKRCSQLAYFAVMMKARSYDRRFFSRNIAPQLYYPQKDAKLLEFGSLVQIDDLEEKPQEPKNIVLFAENYEELLNDWNFKRLLSQKYTVVCTNPPYLNKYNSRLKTFVNKYYKDYAGDLFSVFIYRNFGFCKNNGYTGFMTPFVWMFIKTYEKLRQYIISNKSIVTLIQMEYSAFEEATVPICSFVLQNCQNQTASLCFRLSDFKGGMQVQCQKVLEAIANPDCGYFYEAQQANFSKIPGSPIAYWVSENLKKAFENNNLSDYLNVKQGTSTGNNNKFLRIWYEVKINKIDFSHNINSEFSNKWYPATKGGDFRKWYGNNEYIVNWQNNGYEIKNYYGSAIRNTDINFRDGLTWTGISSKSLGIRYTPKGFIFLISGKGIVGNNKFLKYILGFCCSIVSTEILKIISPTLSFEVGYIASLPIKINYYFFNKINLLVNSNIDLSKQDWDSFETSWDFKEHPLVKWARDLWDATSIAATMDYYYGYHPKVSCPLELCFMLWQGECNKRFTQLKANEEELNRIFIEIYGLHDELTPDVADKDVTVARIYNSKEDIPESMKGNNYVLTKQDVVKSLISYAVGCMFGRYSLDAEGIAYAGGAWDASKYQTFTPDEDNCILITDEAYAKDDIAELFGAWLKKVYGTEQYEENLKFVADALGNKGNSSREVIRNYFLNDFIKDHIKTYKKRPIYWLFDSGKQNGFKALIYLHRYNADTIGNLRVDYLHKMQRIYESEMERLLYTIENGTNAREVAAATKRKEKLQKQLKECRDYDEKISHLALARIELDLDDGVKVNYEKVQTAADGKKYQVLAKI